MVRWALCAVTAFLLLASGLNCSCARRAPDEGPPAQEPTTNAIQEEVPETPPAPRWRWRTGPICIDPGHGGYDSGTVGADGALEKAVALEIACKVRDGLAAKGATVVMTREDDRFVALDGRAAICNEAGAGLFVSIHLNGFDDPKVHGFEVHYFNGGSLAESASAAEAVREALGAAGDARDRGVRRSDFVVLAASKCPAVLVEAGYLTNPAESARLQDEAYRERIAAAIVAGITAYGADEIRPPAGEGPLAAERAPEETREGQQ